MEPTTARARPPWRHRPVARFGLVVALASLALGWAAPSLAESLFFRPDHDVRASASRYGAEDIWFSAPDGPRLHGWWLPPQGEPRGTVVYCHGNHANVTRHTHYVQWLPARGYAVLVFDYRGYGRSEGSPSRAGLVEDSIAALDFALTRDPERTVVFGHSLGGALAVPAAVARPAVRAVVAESTFATYRGAARHQAGFLRGLVPWLIAAGNDPLDVVADLSPRPLLVIHGARDRVVAPALGRALFDAAREPKRLHIAPHSSHMTPWREEGEAFEEMVAGFFDAALGHVR